MLSKRTKTLTNILISHAVFIALFGAAAFAFAQEGGPNRPAGDAVPMPIRAEIASGSADRQANREEIRANIASNTEARQEAREERRAQLQEKTQERVTNLAANMSNRMEAAIGRFENIIGRMKNRLDQLEQNGVDIDAAAEALAGAEASIEAAREELAGIDAAVAAAVGSEDVRADWTGVRGTFERSREHLRAAHVALKESVAALKEAVRAANGANSGVDDAVRMGQPAVPPIENDDSATEETETEEDDTTTGEES